MAAGLNPVRLLPVCLVVMLGLEGCAGAVGEGTALGGAAAAEGGVSPEEEALVARGKKQFLRCAGCHDFQAGNAFMLGPHLQSIVGRKVASLPGFNYTDALRAQDFSWDEARLESWLESPQQWVPDMCMPFRGIADPAARQALIAFLKNPGE